MMKQKTLFRSILVVFAVLIAAMALLSSCAPAQTSEGEKTITVKIIAGMGGPIVKTITTDAEYLRGALEQEDLIAGEDGPYGLFIKTVNGIPADDAQKQWWCITKGGEDVFTGVDSTPIADGDVFEITLKTGY